MREKFGSFKVLQGSYGVWAKLSRRQQVLAFGTLSKEGRRDGRDFGPELGARWSPPGSIHSWL